MRLVSSVYYTPVTEAELPVAEGVLPVGTEQQGSTAVCQDFLLPQEGSSIAASLA